MRSASKIKDPGVVFSRRGAFVMRASAASKARSQSLLSGQKPVSRSGDICSALSNCFQFQLKSSMPFVKSSFPCDLDEVAGESFAYVVEGVGGGQKKFMIYLLLSSLEPKARNINSYVFALNVSSFIS